MVIWSVVYLQTDEVICMFLCGIDCEDFLRLKWIHKPEPKEISSDSDEFCQFGNWIF
jgi:hypothetical protein